MDYRMIEVAHGQTYFHPDEFAVYEYGTYGRGSVLAGRTKRTYIAGGFASIAEAQKAHPEAEVSPSLS